jgi:hypothetical protein
MGAGVSMTGSESPQATATSTARLATSVRRMANDTAGAAAVALSPCQKNPDVKLVKAWRQ